MERALFWAVVSLSGIGLATANPLALCRMTLIPAPAVGGSYAVLQPPADERKLVTQLKRQDERSCVSKAISKNSRSARTS
jgi:hypothetical protein